MVSPGRNIPAKTFPPAAGALSGYALRRAVFFTAAAEDPARRATGPLFFRLGGTMV